MSNPATGFIEETASGSGSDSDTNSEDSPEYYQPISAAENEELGSDSEPEPLNSDEDHNNNNNNNNTSNYHRLPNGHIHHAENGISALDLNNENIDEEEEVRSEVTSDSAIWIAFREDESRRNAPLTPENATRVMEAMRGISFSGIAPEWANGVPEDRWINQLRRLRQSPQTTTTSTTIHP